MENEDRRNLPEISVERQRQKYRREKKGGFEDQSEQQGILKERDERKQGGESHQ